MEELVFDIDDLADATSPAAPVPQASLPVVELSPEDKEHLAKLSPAARVLALPTLPELPRENRARLLLQSPSRLYFYWTLASNPYRTLVDAFSNGIGSYTLAVRLIDLENETEELYSVEPEGAWWFTVRPDAEYRAEIGLFAPNRPFIRTLFSNVVRTPRNEPSDQPAASAEWEVPVEKFVEVLDVSGFSQDAAEVAAAAIFDDSGRKAFTTSLERSLGRPEGDLEEIDPDEIRAALVSLAGGAAIEELKWQISGKLYSILQADLERSVSLGRRFLEEDTGDAGTDREDSVFAVAGASLINLPRRRSYPKYAPISSLDLR